MDELFPDSPTEGFFVTAAWNEEILGEEAENARQLRPSVTYMSYTSHSIQRGRQNMPLEISAKMWYTIIL
ncbi:hypothetical protein B5G00_16210 [Blautia sp. An46]|nr:hypothetical protein B5G00_16210 [Blautia sp. An46]